MAQHSEWEDMQRRLFGDSPGHGGPSRGDPSMPSPFDQGDHGPQ
jgi:hypothetical protein